MIVYPNCKINLGLKVVRKRPDGYHDLETVFYPIPLCDKLEAVVGSGTEGTCSLAISGNPVDGELSDNLIVKAYRMLSADHRLPHIDFNLEKHIPSQAGLGGGSSDATYTLRLLNGLCKLHLDSATLHRYAARLGADCAFFVASIPSFATRIGDSKAFHSHFYRTSVCIRKATASCNKMQGHSGTTCWQRVAQKSYERFRGIGIQTVSGIARHKRKTLQYGGALCTNVGQRKCLLWDF